MTVEIQPGRTTPTGSTPYPLHVDLATGDVGRQDFWRGEVSRVVGFQPDPQTQAITLPFDAFAVEPQQAVGMVVVAVDDKGNLFSFGGPITAVRGE